MTGSDMTKARRQLGEAWGLGRPLHLSEMARILRLTSGSDGIRDYERGKSAISGPMSLAIDLMLAGARPPALESLLDREV